jgi:hypothetical protein
VYTPIGSRSPTPNLPPVGTIVAGGVIAAVRMATGERTGVTSGETTRETPGVTAGDTTGVTSGDTTCVTTGEATGVTSRETTGVTASSCNGLGDSIGFTGFAVATGYKLSKEDYMERKVGMYNGWIDYKLTPENHPPLRYLKAQRTSKL